jgi:hypothetical protein
MKDKIEINKCRQLIDNNQNYSDSQIEQIRDRLYVLGDLVVNAFQKIKAKFITTVQTFTCKAAIAK